MNRMKSIFRMFAGYNAWDNQRFMRLRPSLATPSIAPITALFSARCTARSIIGS